MKLGTLTSYSDKLLRGFRTKAFLICLSVAGTELFFRLAEASLCSLMLYFGELKPIELFTGQYLLKSAVSISCTILRWLAAAPLTYAAACRFTGLCSDCPKLRDTTISEILLSRRDFLRSICALLCSKAAGIIFAVPAAFFGTVTFSLVSGGISGNSPSQLFMAVHAAVMTISSAVLWIWAKLAMLTIPFLMVYFPDRSIPRLVRDSLIFMKGRRMTLIRLFLRKLPAMLPVVTIPLVLPGLYTSAALCINIFIKEDEYREGNQTDRGNGKARNPSKLSAWTKRRLTAAADEAQASAYGNNT